MESWENFRRQILKLNENRVHKVSNSLGVYDAYKYIRKNKWFNIGRSLTEHEFYSIIRKINNYLADSLIKGEDVSLPHRMGRLEIRKYKASISFQEGKVKTNLPIDWDKTLKLWLEDEESFAHKTLIRQEEKDIFKVYYNKTKACYNNKSFYEFKVSRDIKKGLKSRIKEGVLDAFEFK